MKPISATNDRHFNRIHNYTAEVYMDKFNTLDIIKRLPLIKYMKLTSATHARLSDMLMHLGRQNYMEDHMKKFDISSSTV